MTKPKMAIKIAQAIIEGKINNQRVVVQRRSKGANWTKSALKRMDKMRKEIKNTDNLDELRGHEGMAARDYFHLLRRLIKPPSDDRSWGFDRREYYPPPDPINAMLSFGYTLLLNDLISACQMAGLDPDLGFLHAINYGKPSMALDLEEEFRPIIVDSIVLTAVNRPLFSINEFERRSIPKSKEKQNHNRDKNYYAVKMTDDARRRFIRLYETRINEQIYYPPSGKQTSYRQIFQLQAYQMARLILGEADRYRPFLIR